MPDDSWLPKGLLPVQRQAVEELKAEFNRPAWPEGTAADYAAATHNIVTNARELGRAAHAMSADGRARCDEHQAPASRGPSLAEVAEALRRYYSSFPGVAEYMSYTRGKIRVFVISPTGRLSPAPDEIFLDPVLIRKRGPTETGRTSSRDAGLANTPRPAERKLSDFGLAGGMAKLLAEETAPPEPPRAFKKGSFFPPESVAKDRRKLNKPPRGKRR